MSDGSAFNFDPFQTDFSFDFQNLPTTPTVAGPSGLGILLMEMGALTEETLNQALAHQAEQRLPLAQILLEGGYCTQDQVNEALRRRPSHR
ncbi:MAG: hypothetical protein VKO64_01580 [Candidatus Sericytochromatia bacterium]|nr:hypothetical protein [Candidatus Sericytochromatia bacterium]